MVLVLNHLKLLFLKVFSKMYANDDDDGQDDEVHLLPPLPGLHGDDVALGGQGGASLASDFSERKWPDLPARLYTL